MLWVSKSVILLHAIHKEMDSRNEIFVVLKILVIVSRKLPQHKWRSLLPELTSALNTSESNATKCSPYYVAFGRSAWLPIDVLFCDNEPSVGDYNTPLTCAHERQLILRDVFDVVFNNLQISKLKMQPQYNENLRFLRSSRRRESMVKSKVLQD